MLLHEGNTVTVTMATDFPSQIMDEFSSEDQDYCQGGLARLPLVRQTSKELPPLVGAPSSASASRYAENNNLNPLTVAANGCHPSPTQRRKLRYPTNLQVLWNTNKEANLSEVSKIVTTPSPPVTPRTLSDCPSPGLLRRCRQRSSTSLDGSPLVRRRSSEQHLSVFSGRPGTPVESPRITRSFSLGGNLNEMSERSAKLLLLGSQGLTKSSDAINEHLLNQLSLHQSPEGRNSISDQSGDNLVLKTVSQLHVVAEENVEESSSLTPLRIERIVDDETGEVLRSKVNTPMDDSEGASHGRTTEGGFRKASHSTGNVTNTRDFNEFGDDSDEDLPDYQKKPIPTSSRIAAWLEGLTDHQLEQKSTITKGTLPEIGNR
ncbi:hypothetical protein HOLleu_33652 [Holothuria leucospilota]|uniref:Uncharacterized protein n=1 Tax=Holothuria leucospilota TaxID=206669 RepID=A0A9Q1BFK9_HOLLE|nr:hypothetical protein HOLleu_33652 [Holothuria leucospilota]